MIELRDIQSKAATREVLGCLLQDPTLLVNHKIQIDDFVEAFHQLLFAAINNKFANKAVLLDSFIIDDYLKENYPERYIIFSRNDGINYVDKVKKKAKLKNFESNYLDLKKYSLLRKLYKNGIDISDFCNPEELDPKEAEKIKENFEESSIEDIIKFYRNKLLNIFSDFNIKDDKSSVKAGSEEARLQKEAWKLKPDFGLSYSSNYLTKVAYGIRKKRYNVLSAGTGTGKTRLSVANICHSFAPKYYDEKLKKFVDNPHGKQNAALYIGTEMELIEEIEPILWAYIANVPEEHIIMGNYLPGEEERVDEAIRILNEEGNIYMEYVPSYDVETLERTIEEHVIKHNVHHVFFDYIHITTDLISEFQNEAKAKMQVREDQVLGNLSDKLKQITRKYNISLDTWTQVTGDFKNEQNRDQTIVRGAKAIIDKADLAGIVSIPTLKELKLLEKISRTAEYFGKPLPNICISVYKNRGGRYNKVKIWLYVDFDTMRVHDLYVTDYSYEIADITESFTYINEDQQIVVTNSKEELKEKMKSEVIKIEDDGNIVNDFEDIEDIEDESENQIIEAKEETRLRELEDLEDFVNNNLVLNSGISEEDL